MVSRTPTSKDGVPQQSGTPGVVASTQPGSTAYPDVSFTMALLDVRDKLADINVKLAEQGVKVDRLVSDVSSHSTKLDNVRITMAKWTGIIAVLAFLLPILGKFAGDWLVKVLAR